MYCWFSVSREVCGYAEFDEYLSVGFCFYLHPYFYLYCGSSVVGLKGVSLAEGEVFAYVVCVYGVDVGGCDCSGWLILLLL